MQSEFDKEIDSLLREGARRGRAAPAAPVRWGASEREEEDDGSLLRATPSNAHLDADEQNAYAENSLPASARTHYAAHLADCDDCRRSVTQLALAAGVPAQLEQQAAAKAREVLPSAGWRERLGALFAPRAWRYAVPALALLLVGAVALMVSMRSNRQGEVSIAKRDASEQARNTAAAPETHHAPQGNNAPASNANNVAPGELNASNSNATQAKEQVAVNTAERRETSAPHPVTGGVLSDEAPPPPPAPASVGSTAAGRAISEMLPTPVPTPEPVVDAVTVTSEPEAKGKNVESVEEMAKDAQKPGNFENRQQQPRERISGPRRNMEQSRNMQRGNVSIARADEDKNGAVLASPSAPPAATATTAARSAKQRGEDRERDDARKSEGTPLPKPAPAETRTVAGRKFRRQGNAWIDTAYNSSQAATIVRRNSEQYRALIADEPQLRRIGDALGGEVTVVWKGRAYRIR